MKLADKLYGELVKILKVLSVITAIAVFIAFLITAIIYLTTGVTATIVVGIIYLIFSPLIGFISGIALYALARHFENQDKMISELNEIKSNTKASSKEEE